MDLIDDVVVNPENGFVLENQTTGSESSFWEEVGRAQPERVRYRRKSIHHLAAKKKKWDEDKNNVVQLMARMKNFYAVTQMPTSEAAAS